MSTQVIIDLALALIFIVAGFIGVSASTLVHAIITAIFQSPKTRTYIQQEDHHVINILDQTGKIIKTFKQQ